MIKSNPFWLSLWLFSLVAAFACGRLITRSTPAGNTPSVIEANHPSFQGSSPTEDGTTIFPFLPEGASNAEMVAAIVTHDDASSRLKALLALLDTLSPDEFQEVAKALEQSALVDFRDKEYRLLFASWGEVAPEEAMAYATNLFDGTSAKNTILGSWATHDPEAALKWAEGNYASPNADITNPWLMDVVHGAAAQNIDFALSIVEDMPYESKGQKEALGVVLSHWNAQNPEEALQWVHALEEDTFKWEAFNVLSQSIIESDPETAFERVSNLNGGGPLEFVTKEITHSRYLENPKETKDWVATLPEVAIGKAAEIVVSHGTKEDPIATAQWMAGLIESNPDGNYQSAIENLITNSILTEPQVAADWITALHSRTEKNRLYQDVLKQWLEADETAALDWVVYNSQDIPDNVLLRFFPEVELGTENVSAPSAGAR